MARTFTISGRARTCFKLLAAAHLAVAPPLPAAEADAGEFPEFEVRGLADFRFLHPSAGLSWLDRNLGKFRFLGEGDSNLFRVNEGAITVKSRLNWDWSAAVTAKYAAWQKVAVDITESFLLFRPAESPLRFGGRLGMFFPPVSMENEGTAWSSPYTLNSSAINTWIGEELRVFGGEAQASYRFDGGDRLGLFAAGYGNNDTAGVLLAWRGFSLHDYEAVLNDRLPLPAGVGIQKIFPLQSPNTEPFVEVDGTPGFYVGATLERPALGKLRAVYYDNRGRTTAIENGQYAWHTRFGSVGLRLELPWDSLLIGQGLVGGTRMGAPTGGVFPVDVDFWACSLLLTKAFDAHRLSVRHDRFGTSDDDLFPEDLNRETGHAWTVNYNYVFERSHQLNLEVSVIDSDRAARALLGEDPRQDQTLWQVAYRFFF
jgi:hypothetical protein